MIVVGINGSFLRKSATGIGQVSWHFIKTLIQERKSLFDRLSDFQFIVYLEENVPKELLMDVDELPKNIKFKVVSQRFYKRDDLVRKVFWERFWLPRQVKKDGCQKFFSLYQSATVLPRNIKHLMLVHDVVPKVFPEYLNNWRKKIYYKLVDRAVGKAGKILTVSKFSRKEIARFYNVDLNQIEVNYDACDPIFKKELSEEKRKIVLKKYGLDLGEKYIFYFGGFDVRKNVGRVIQAYGQLISEFKEVDEELPNLVLGGQFHKHLVPLVTDIEEEIKQVVSEYEIDEKLFKAIGFVEQEDLPALYQSADVFTYPSLYEGFGMPVLEAMTSKTPVVTSSTTSIPEVISEEAGYLVNNPENVEEIKNQLKEALLDSFEDRQKKINLAFIESEKFSWEKFAENVLSGVESV